mgnify:CR=1 FL=1
MTITVKNYTNNALSAESGKVLRSVILDANATNPTDEIILDFEGIVLFATMFFNASVGYLVKEQKKEALWFILSSNKTL